MMPRVERRRGSDGSDGGNDTGGRRSLRREPGAPGRGRAPAHRPRHLRRRRRAAGDAARLLRPEPVPRARIRGIDASAALALDGVHAVFTAADLNPGVHELWYSMIGKDIPDTPRPPLAEGEVRFVGDPVALVVADDRYLAEDAVDLVDVDYEPLPPVVDYVVGAGVRASSSTRATSATSPAGCAAATATRSTRRSAAPPTSSPRRSTSRPTRRCRWRPAGWSSSGRAAS